MTELIASRSQLPLCSCLNKRRKREREKCGAQLPGRCPLCAKLLTPQVPRSLEIWIDMLTPSWVSSTWHLVNANATFKSFFTILIPQKYHFLELLCPFQWNLLFPSHFSLIRCAVLKRVALTPIENSWPIICLQQLNLVTPVSTLLSSKTAIAMDVELKHPSLLRHRTLL